MPAVRTRLLSADRPADLAEAAHLLAHGEVVALPTETVYGLAANALDPIAVQRVFQAKGRPSDNPLIVHLHSGADVPAWCDPVHAVVRPLTERFWPGALTLVLETRRASGDVPVIPAVVTGGGPTVGVRAPDHPAFQAVLAHCGLPLAAPSANLAGTPSPTTAGHVLADLDGRIAAVLDGGPCRVGVESTVLSLVTEPPTVLRPGGVSLEALAEVLDAVVVNSRVRQGEPVAAPGMKYRHYAPRAPMWVLSGSLPAAAAWVRRRARLAGAELAVLCPAEEAAAFTPVPTEVYGSLTSPDSMAHGLFSALRALDRLDVTEIVARVPTDEHGVLRAVRNRVWRAAAFREIEAERLGDG